MIKNNKGEVILKGTEVEIKAELATLFISLFRSKEYKKSDINKNFRKFIYEIYN